MPVDVLETIFSRLDAHDVSKTVTLVCRHWNSVSRTRFRRRRINIGEQALQALADSHRALRDVYPLVDKLEVNSILCHDSRLVALFDCQPRVVKATQLSHVLAAAVTAEVGVKPQPTLDAKNIVYALCGGTPLPFEFYSVTVVDVRDCAVFDFTHADLGVMCDNLGPRGLRALSFAGDRMGVMGLVTVFRSEMPYLEVLDASHTHETTPPSLETWFLRGIASLRALCLAGSSLIFPSLENLLTCCPALEELDISGVACRSAFPEIWDGVFTRICPRLRLVTAIDCHYSIFKRVRLALPDRCVTGGPSQSEPALAEEVVYRYEHLAVEEKDAFRYRAHRGAVVKFDAEETLARLDSGDESEMQAKKRKLS